MKIVILANDPGDKLWPWASADTPKALLPLYSHCSMLEETILRSLPFCENEGKDMYIVTTTEAVKTIKHKELHSEYKIPYRNILGCDETEINKTIALVVKELDKKVNGNELLAFIPADQFFYPVEGFLFHFNNMLEALKTTHKKKLLLFCIEPAVPAVNVNYVKMKIEDELRVAGKTFIDDGSETNEDSAELYTPVFSIEDYMITPDLATAEELINSKVWCWDLNIWAGQFSLFRKYVNSDDSYSEWVTHLMQLDVVEAALMNKMVWTLIDNWNAIKYLTADSGLFAEQPQSNVHNIESTGNYIKVPSYKDVTLIGIEGLIIVESDDKLLIATPGSLYEHF